MIAASFTAWQMGAGDKMSWQEYLNKHGLGEKTAKMSSEQKADLVKKTDNVAAKIKAAFQKGNYTEMGYNHGA